VLYFLFVNYQSAELIKHAVKNYCSSCLAFKAIIVNNFPPEQTDLETLATDRIRVIDGGGNLGFGRACNLGLSWIYDQHPQALVWLLNPDTFCDPKMITKAQSFFKRYSKISILGTLIYATDNNIWFAGGTFRPKIGKIVSENLLAVNSKKAYFLSDWVSGCSMIINFSHFKECPQFDPNYFLYYEDVDFCQRYKQKGHLVAVTNQIRIMHQVSAITNRNFKSKFYYSTYSYLLTLEKYTNPIFFYLRLIRILVYSIVLLPLKPMIALGKITGAWHYFQQRLSGVTSHTD